MPRKSKCSCACGGHSPKASAPVVASAPTPASAPASAPTPAPASAKPKRPLTAYQLFMKAKLSEDQYKSLPPKQRFATIAKMWQDQKQKVA